MARRNTALDAPLWPINPEYVREDDCKAIWCAVLMRALLDLQENASDENSAYGKDMEKHRRDAWRFFFADYRREDFIIVCTYAGFDPRIVKEKAREIVETGSLFKTLYRVR